MDHRPLLQCQQRLLPPATTSDINAVTTLDNLLQSAKPLCGKCGQEVMSSEPSCAQPKSKSGGAFVRNACHARINLINRAWGIMGCQCVGMCWILSKSFMMRSKKHCGLLCTTRPVVMSKWPIVTALPGAMLTNFSHGQKESEGEWLPLTVYAARGYNVKDIEEKSKDVVEHPVLGTCYRVCIQALDCESTVEDTCRREEASPAISWPQTSAWASSPFGKEGS